MIKQHTPGPYSIHYWHSRDDSGIMYEGNNNGVEIYSAQGVERHFKIVADKKHLGASRTFGSFEGCHIAKIDIVPDGLTETDSYDEALANALLLKASPQLLSACKAAKEWIDQFGEHAPIIFGGEAELSNQLWEAIHAAELYFPDAETESEVGSMRYWRNSESGTVIAMPNSPGEIWYEIEIDEYEVES